MQGHVFNAHYLTYVRRRHRPRGCASASATSEAAGFDMVLKTADADLARRRQRSTTTLAIDVAVSRWGTHQLRRRRSTGSVGEQPVFDRRRHLRRR